MKDHKKWVEALQIDPSEVNQWLEEVPSPEVLTFWALDRGKVDSQKYFEWAKEHYGLAQLKADFFKLPANSQLWTQMESVANWSPQMIPVHEWDGVVFVACVEPDLDIKWSFPVQYVLANTAELKSHWEVLNSAEAAVPEPEAKIEMPEPEPQPEAEAEPEPEPEAPEGISFSFETNADAPTEEAPIDEDEVKTSPGDSPIGLSDEPPAAPVLQLDNLMPATDEAPAAEEPAAEEPAAEEPVAEPVAAAEEPVAEPVVAAAPETSEPKVPSSPPPPSNYDTGTSAHEITRVAGVLDHLKNDFEGSILLTMEGEQLKPLVWDSMWKPNGENKGPENLKDASAFRVVVRTKHPYLGHVIDTPVNRNFFEAWGINEFPEKILVQPIVDGGSLLAVMVCVCNPGVKNQVLLSAGTKHAKELATMLNEGSQASAA